jgi:nucleoside-diphosphate-sugar epimerase
MTATDIGFATVMTATDIDKTRRLYLMRIFVTGASGFIGSAVVPELIAAGHDVVGLARSDASAAALETAGAAVHRGDLDDLDSLAASAAASDGVIHLAYNHDFVDMAAAAQGDLRAIEAIGEALVGSDKPLVIASGTLGLAFGRSTPMADRAATEQDVPTSAMSRVASENATIALAKRGVRSSSVRLSPTVHGEGDHGFMPRLISIARDKGVSAFVGDGANRWPAVHRLDAARLFRLAMESAPAGSRLHAVGDEGVAWRDIAGVIGRQLDLPVVGISSEEAAAHFGFLGALVSADNPTSSAFTQDLLEWKPDGPGLIADLEQGFYFTTGTVEA